MEGQWPKQGQASKPKMELSANTVETEASNVVTPMATYVMSAQANAK